MRRLFMAVGAAVAAALILSGPVAAESGVKTLRPLDGVSLDVGSKRVVGFYVASAHACSLTLMMGELLVEDQEPAGSAARLQQTLAPNTLARLDTTDGESLEFACQPGAATMTVRLLKQVAFKPAQ